MKNKVFVNTVCILLAAILLLLFFIVGRNFVRKKLGIAATDTDAIEATQTNALIATQTDANDSSSDIDIIESSSSQDDSEDEVSSKEELSKPEPESKIGSEPESETEPKPEPEPVLEPEPKPEPEPESKPELESSASSKVNTGKIKPNFTNAPDDYFEDALFIGDSRTNGLQIYSPLKGADYFCTTGMSTYNVYDSTCYIDGIGECYFKTLMANKQYGKIYIMLGINEVSFERSSTIQRYYDFVKAIKMWQPNAIIFIEANMHVDKNRSSTDPNCNNKQINAINSEYAKLADGKTIFYLDVNPIFDDDGGNLRSEYTFDGTHIFAEYYKDWTNWLKTKAILREEA